MSETFETLKAPALARELVREGEPTSAQVQIEYGDALRIISEQKAAYDILAAQLAKAEDEWIRIASQNARDATTRLEVVEAERDALAQQLQQAQEEISLHCHEQELAAEELDHIVADRDRWVLNYNMAQADLARARGSYEADVLRLTGERNDAREQLQPMTADRDYWKARAHEKPVTT
jgi:capsule polysaccharide export protein KpsE/RkpR